MTAHPELVRWSGHAGEGIESTGPAPASEQVALLLQAITESAHLNTAFVLLPLASFFGRSDQSAIEEITSKARDVRVCVATSRAELSRSSASALVSADIGLLLDCVSIDTPLSAFLVEGVEAVRFHSDFLIHANESLKAAAALQATLGLARDLCLTTFAPTNIGPKLAVGHSFGFDYVCDGSRPARGTGSNSGLAAVRRAS